MLLPSTIQLLRVHFSVFLMPVYWFALSQLAAIDTMDALLVFGILHLLVYPASNGYNSYMDRDTGSIGGVSKPMQPTRQLFYVTVWMDAAAVLLSCLLSGWFALGIILYILASRAYSYRRIRLKKYPLAGYLTVVVFQGAVCFFLVYHGSSPAKTLSVPPVAMIASSLLIGGFYPLTQIYQHQQDRDDGVTTISMLLGYKGTFIFTAIVYVFAVSALAYQLISTGQQRQFLLIQIFFIPVLVYFLWWFRKVLANNSGANFVYTMRMNILASLCTNTAFIVLFLIQRT
jgi:1,4-dihydroxy-2-naphthoate octaprenyltransferase